MIDKKALLAKRIELDIVEIFDDKLPEDIQRYFETLDEKPLAGDSFRKFSAQRYGYDGGIVLYLDTYRWETDEEYALRQEHEAEKKRKQEEKLALKKAQADERARKQLLSSEEAERELYEKLRKKFEKDETGA